MGEKMNNEISPSALRSVLKKVQNQYDQIVKMAEKNQARGIEVLAKNWTGSEAERNINQLVKDLNLCFTGSNSSVNSAFSKLFESLNGYASDALKTYGESWSNVEFDIHSKEIFVNSVGSSASGEIQKFDESQVVEALSRIQQLSKNVIKNSMETQNIVKFSDAIKGTGITDMLSTLASNLKQVSELIDTSINRIASQLTNKSSTFATNLEAARKKRDVSSLW